MRRLSILLISCITSTAGANPDVAVAVNPPLRWVGAGALAGSVYWGVTQTDAVRFNVARYEYAGDFPLRVVFSDGDGHELYGGRVIDGGVGWVHFFDKLHTGLFFDFGALVRRNDVSVEDDFAFAFRTETNTTVYAGRVMIGWSWKAADPIFIALSLGFSGGYERGSETKRPDPMVSDRMPVTTSVSRDVLAPEGWLRLGVDFGAW